MFSNKSETDGSDSKMVEVDHIIQQHDQDMENQSIDKETSQEIDPFGVELDVQVHYKTMNWWYV